jgi:hypothetical protein
MRLVLHDGGVIVYRVAPEHVGAEQVLCTTVFSIKVSVSRDFSGPFLACMDRSRSV